jgi:hypothetical protein
MTIVLPANTVIVTIAVIMTMKTKKLLVMLARIATVIGARMVLNI